MTRSTNVDLDESVRNWKVPAAVRTEDAVAELIMRARRAIDNEWAVTDTCTPTVAGTDSSRRILDVPVVGVMNSETNVAGNDWQRVDPTGVTSFL